MKDVYEGFWVLCPQDIVIAGNDVTILTSENLVNSTFSMKIEAKER
jgi:hypothetical protein